MFVVGQGTLDNKLDPRLDDEKKTVGLIEEVDEIQLEENNIKRKVKIGTELTL